MDKFRVILGSEYTHRTMVEICLPCEDDLLQKELDIVSFNRQHDIYVADVDNTHGFNLKWEYVDWSKFNQFLIELEELENQGNVIVMADILLGDNIGYDEIISIIRDGDMIVIRDVQNDTDLGTKVDECYLPVEIPDDVRPFIDWEEIGIAMQCNDNWYISDKHRVGYLINR
jgi:hypothetical protein